jgi:hypothetical protein
MLRGYPQLRPAHAQFHFLLNIIANEIAEVRPPRYL